MTAPGTAPGSVPRPTEDIAQRVRRLEERIEELSRKDLSNAQVGQGGRIRGLYSNGQEAFQFGRDPVDGQNKALIRYSDGTRALGIGAGAAAYGSQETLSVFDLAGNAMFQTDELAGYGLSRPSYCYTLNGFEETDLNGATTSATASAKAFGYSYVYNPAIQFWVRMRMRNTTASTFNVRAEVDSNGVTYATSDQQFSVGAGAINVQNFNRILLLPEEAMGQQASIRIMVWNSTGSNALVTAYVQMCSGVAKSLYDSSPGIH